MYFSKKAYNFLYNNYLQQKNHCYSLNTKIKFFLNKQKRLFCL